MKVADSRTRDGICHHLPERLGVFMSLGELLHLVFFGLCGRDVTKS